MPVVILSVKIYISHASKWDYKKHLYEPLKQSTLMKNHELIFPHEHHTNAAEVLKHCTILIAEVSFASTGAGIEIGLANAYGLKIICVYKKGTVPSDSLKLISDSMVEYGDEAELVQKLEAAVR